MSLPASGSMSDAQVLAELRTANANRAYPLSSNDADLLALAGKSAPPLTLPNDLYGKSGALPLSASATGDQLLDNNAGVIYLSHLHPTVTASDGSGNYSYQWAITNAPDNNFILSAANSASCDVARTIGRLGYTGSVVLSCIVSDGQTSITLDSIVCAYVAGDINQ